MKAKIYTKSGDKGETSLVGGARVRKSHPRLDAYGTLDELSSVIGLLRAHLEHAKTDLKTKVESRLQTVQNNLFNVGSHLACESDELRKSLPNLNEELLIALETDMDQWEAELPPLKNFILPGGSAVAGFAHLARTICRRAEREAVKLDMEVPVSPDHIIFLNRLSDWLFLLARKLNSDLGQTDLQWTK